MKNRKRPKKKVIIILIAVAAIVIGGVITVNGRMQKMESIPQVEVVTVERGDVAEELDATGTVKSMKKKVFFSPVNARIQKMAVSAGDSVRAGDQLITYDLDELEKENQKAELNVRSGQHDYNDTVNQANEAAAKQAAAAANANSLQAQVDDWQQYVYDLQAAIEQENQKAQEQADREAAAAMQEAQRARDSRKQELSAQKEEALMAYNEARTQYNMAMKRWEQSPTEENEADVAEKEESLSQTQIAYENAETEYRQHLEMNPQTAGEITVKGDTSELERKLNDANTTLAQLQSELATEKAMVDSDVTSLSSDTLAKLEISNNLSELEAKSVEELIAEGKKGIQAEFTGVISVSQVVEGATVSQGMELFTLESTEEVCVEISVSKYDYALLKEGQKADIEMGDHIYHGTLTKVNRIAIPNDKGTPMIGAVVKIDDPDEEIFIGVEAKVTLHAAEASQVLIVPVETVNIGKNGSFCYVLRDGIIEKQNVKIGVTSDTYVEVTEGLQEGDQVITDIGALEEGSRAVSGGEDAA